MVIVESMALAAPWWSAYVERRHRACRRAAGRSAAHAARDERDHGDRLDAPSIWGSSHIEKQADYPARWAVFRREPGRGPAGRGAVHRASLAGGHGRRCEHAAPAQQIWPLGSLGAAGGAS